MTDRVRNCIKLISEEGDQTAFRTFYDHFSPRLYSFALSLTRSAHSAEEVVGDVFVSIWKNRQMIASVSNIDYYLFAAVRNTAYNYIEKQKRLRTTLLPQDEAIGTINYATPETDRMQRENVQEIIAAIQSLPEKCQLIFRLAKEEGFSYKEIAELLGITPKTVENQMSIALKKIVTAIRASLPEYKKHYRRS